MNLVHSDFFEEYTNKDGKQGVKLKHDKTASDLIKQFRGALSLDTLKAFTSQEAIDTLFE